MTAALLPVGRDGDWLLAEALGRVFIPNDWNPTADLNMALAAVDEYGVDRMSLRTAAGLTVATLMVDGHMGQGHSGPEEGRAVAVCRALVSLIHQRTRADFVDRVIRGLDHGSKLSDVPPAPPAKPGHD